MNTATWIPLVPSRLINMGEVEQLFVEGKDVVVWRSLHGCVQIWENRCPHRSVRLSLGSVQGESLVCAYHGWRFAAEDGHCQRIPAQSEQRAPKSVCARSYSTMECSGMIWYSREMTSVDDSLFEDIPQVYAGSVVISVGLSQVQDYLLELGLQQLAQGHGLVWQNDAADSTLRMYLTPSQSNMVAVHAMLLQTEKPLKRHPLLNQMRQFLEREQLSHV